MFVFDYSECSDLIREITTAAEGDLVFGVIEELTDEGLYTQRQTTPEMNRFCRKILTVGIVTAIVYHAYRDTDSYYEKMLNAVVDAANDYMEDVVQYDVMYEEDGMAYGSSWVAFVPSILPFNIRAKDDVEDIAEIIGGIVIDTINELDFSEDPEFKTMTRRLQRHHQRAMGSHTTPPDLEVCLSNRTYTLIPFTSRPMASKATRQSIRH